jgi:hypothetical protein
MLLSDETFNIANGTVSTTGTILDDNNPLWQRSPASATEGSDVVFNFTLSNPSDKVTPILLF